MNGKQAVENEAGVKDYIVTGIELSGGDLMMVPGLWGLSGRQSGEETEVQIRVSEARVWQRTGLVVLGLA